jgi:hypothetical protein
MERYCPRVRFSGVHDEFTPAAAVLEKPALSCVDTWCAILGLNQCIPLLAHAQTRRCTTPPIPKGVEVGVPG